MSKDYEHCEVYLIPADSDKQATKKAQAVRSRLVKQGKALPTQSAPYRAD
jgi:ribosome-binding factor A